MVSIAAASVLVGISAGMCCRLQGLVLICMLGAFGHLAFSGIHETAILNAVLTVVALQVGFFVAIVVTAMELDRTPEPIAVPATEKQPKVGGDQFARHG